MLSPVLQHASSVQYLTPSRHTKGISLMYHSYELDVDGRARMLEYP